MTTTEKNDADPLGELGDAERLLKAACTLAEHLIPEGTDQESILGVIYAALDKIEAASAAITKETK